MSGLQGLLDEIRELEMRVPQRSTARTRHLIIQSNGDMLTFAHSRYHKFTAYGDAEHCQKRLEELRKAFKDK